MNLAFNARTVAPNSGGTKLPPGEYPFVITGEEIKDKAIYFTLTVGQGNQFAGTTFRHRLGLWSDNTEEYRIAWEKLSQLCHVTGVLDLQDTAQLRNIPFYGTIENQKNSDKYTELKKVKDTQGRSPNEIAKSVGTVAGQAPQAAAPQVQAAAPAQVYSAPAPPANGGFVPSGAYTPAPPPGPQVGYPTQPPAAPSFAAPAPTFTAPQPPAQSPAPWGAPPAAPNGAPPAWAK